MLFVLFIVVPAVELMLIIEVGSRIGTLATLLTIVATGVAGVTLAKSEGMAVMERMRQAVQEGRMPKAEVVDGLLILVAAVLLLTPGFLTDAFGLLVLFPLTRPFFRQLALRWFGHKIQMMAPPMPPRPAWPPRDEDEE